MKPKKAKHVIKTGFNETVFHLSYFKTFCFMKVKTTFFFLLGKAEIENLSSAKYVCQNNIRNLKYLHFMLNDFFPPADMWKTVLNSFMPISKLSFKWGYVKSVNYSDLQIHGWTSEKSKMSTKKIKRYTFSLEIILSDI